MTLAFKSSITFTLTDDPSLHVYKQASLFAYKNKSLLAVYKPN